MKRLIVLALLLTSAWAETPRQTIDDIVKNPGLWDQNCRGPALKPYKTLPLFGYRRIWSDSKISKENFEKLRADRLEVVREVAREIDAINVQRSLEDFSRGEVLMMIELDLNGVEALSALLRLEKEFDKMAYYRVKSPRVPGPQPMLPAHVQVLSVITAILQNERAAGLAQLGKTATYDRPTRDLIVRLAKSFVDQVDPKDYRRGAGMAPEPTTR